MFGRLVLRLTSNAPIDHFTGHAWVIDGDTLVIKGRRVRLHGIDAPELDQVFWCRDQELASGAMAMAALEALTAGVLIRCEVIEQDRHDRLIAKCFSPNGVDIGRRMVSSGWALAYRQYSTEYVDAEAEARAARRGLWRGRFAKPWEWRARKAG
jgi:endonuclease YncB( thermonuclease family)